MQLVEVEVMRLGLDRSTNSYVVILQEKGGARLLPIWIGQPEAESIVIEMNKLKRERPLTHDLCKNLIIGLGGTLRRVNITKVENRTFYAELHIARNSGPVHIDARPSVSGAWVVLHRVGPDRAGPLDSIQSDARGRYSFSYERTGSEDAVYFVSAS